MRTWQAALAVVAGAVCLALLLGPGYAGYDASWSLVWGREIAHGVLPSYDGPLAPTPHPLANLVAAALSVFDDGGEGALLALSFLAFAALLAGMVVLGRRVWTLRAGIVAATVLGSRGLLDREVAFASVDIPFLAFVVWAGALAARRPARPIAALALLAFAGLLRPEAWPLSLLYAGWLASTRPSISMPRLAALAVAAPVLWALSDLLVTGNPLHSLTGTRDLAAELDRPTGLSTALSGLPGALADVLGAAILAAAMLGFVAAAALAARRLVLPLAALACGIAMFLVIGVLELPVLVRYLLLPTCALALGAGVGVDLAAHARGGMARRVGRATGAIVAVLLAIGIPGTLGELHDARAFTAARGAVHRDLRAIVGGPRFTAAAVRCPQTLVPDFRSLPVLLRDGTIDPRRAVVGNLPDGTRGLLLTYRSHVTAAVFTLGAQGEVRLQALPAGAGIVGRNRSWIAAAAC